ncbi:MAG: FAD-dependent monooxygenase [Dermatophilaceae bacterium]
MTGPGPRRGPAKFDADVIVVGGGPVGLAAALYAAQAGLVPVVVEPRAGVIDKACGEGLMPGGVLALAELGVDPAGYDLRGIRYLGGGRSVEAPFRHGLGRGVRRTTLHAALREAVAAAGIEVLTLAATDVRQDHRSVTVATVHPGGDVGPDLGVPYVLAADGLHSPIRRILHLDPRYPTPAAASRGRSASTRSGAARSEAARLHPEDRRFGLRQHFAIAPWSDHVEVYWGPHSEAYVTPVSDSLVGVAVLGSRRTPLQDSLSDFPDLGERLADREVVTSVMGAGPLRQRATSPLSGRVLLVGDASGYVDALTGEGIALGLAHARAAVATIRAGRPADYEREWRRATRRYAVMTHVLVQATRPAWTRRLLVPASASLRPVFRAAVNELAKPG